MKENVFPGLKSWWSSSLFEPEGLDGREENSDNPEESDTLLNPLCTVSMVWLLVYMVLGVLGEYMRVSS